jgi:hypothetical protein
VPSPTLWFFSAPHQTGDLMQPAEAPSRAAHAFQLVTALDHYLFRLDELDSCAPEQSARHLMDLTDSVRNVRIRCAAFPTVQVHFLDLLIGHSELVFKVTQTSRRWNGKRTRSALVSGQRRRAETLLRKFTHPLGPAADQFFNRILGIGRRTSEEAL